MNKKKRQAISLVGVLTVMIAFFITPIMALAASVNYEKIGDYVSTEYCGQFEPLMRNLEPASAGDKTGQCGR
ncbi:hypothetical protein [Enterococcus olivae]